MPLSKGLFYEQMNEVATTGNSGDVQEIHQRKQRVIEGSKDFWSTSRPHLGVVFALSVTSRLQKRRFSMPQWPQFGLQQELRRGLLGRETGEAIDDVQAVLPFLADGAFQAEDLGNTRPLVGKAVSSLPLLMPIHLE